MTVLTATVPDDDAGNLTDVFGRSTAELPRASSRGFLLRRRGSDRWRIVAVRRGAEDLAARQAPVDTPEGARMFRPVGAEPALSSHDVAPPHLADTAAARGRRT